MPEDTKKQDPFDTFLATRDKKASAVSTAENQNAPPADPFDVFLVKRNAQIDTDKAANAAKVQSEAVASTKGKLKLPMVKSSTMDKALGALSPEPAQPLSTEERENAPSVSSDSMAGSRALMGLPPTPETKEAQAEVAAKTVENLTTGSKKMPIPAFKGTEPKNLKEALLPPMRMSSVGELTDLTNEYLNDPRQPKSRTAAFAAGVTADSVNTLNDMFLSPVGLAASGTGLVAANALAKSGRAGTEALKLMEEYQAMKRAGATADELLLQQGKIRQATEAVAKAQGTAKTAANIGRAGAVGFGAQGGNSFVEGIKDKDPSKVLSGLAQIVLAGAGEAGIRKAGGVESVIKAATAKAAAEGFEGTQPVTSATRTPQVPETPTPEAPTPEPVALLEQELSQAKSAVAADNLETAAKELRKAAKMPEEPSKQVEKQEVPTKELAVAELGPAQPTERKPLATAESATQERPAAAGSAETPTSVQQAAPPAEKTIAQPEAKVESVSRDVPRAEKVPRDEIHNLLQLPSESEAVANPEVLRDLPQRVDAFMAQGPSADAAAKAQGQLSVLRERVPAAREAIEGAMRNLRGAGAESSSELSPTTEHKATVPQAPSGTSQQTRGSSKPTGPNKSASAATKESPESGRVDRRSAGSVGKPPVGVADRRAIEATTPPMPLLVTEAKKILADPKSTDRDKEIAQRQLDDYKEDPGLLGGGEKLGKDIRTAREKSSGQPISKEAALANQAKRKVPFTNKPRLEKAKGSDYGRRQAQFFANLQRNPIEKEYAQSYLKARLEGKAEPVPSSALTPQRATELKSSIESRLSVEQPKKLTEKFSPEVIAAAQAELRSGYELASSFEKPGRYQADLGEGASARAQDAAWYGISSSRGDVAQMFPWYKDIKQGSEGLGQLIAKGKGAEYDRLVATIAEHVQREKESAAPVIAEFAPRLKALSTEIDGNDQDLSDLLAQLANGDGRGFTNLRSYIEQKVSDAEQARDFFRLIDDAASEARETGAEETPESRPELRPTESAESRKEKQSALPGLEAAIEEQKTSSEKVQAEKLTEELSKPLGDIESAAGEMESKSPLFRGTEASPQKELFQASSPAASVGDRVQPTEGGLAGKTVEVTKVGDSGVYVREGNGPVKFVKNGEFRVAPETEQTRPSLFGTTLHSNPFFDPEVWKATLGYLKPSEAAGQPNLRAKTGQFARKQAVLQEKLKKERRRWRGRSDADMLAFADFVENGEADRANRGIKLDAKTQAMLDKGKTSLTPQDKNLAATLRTLLDEGRRSVQKLGTGKLESFIENYFPHIWEKHGGKVAAAIGQIMGKRPLEGAKSFLKQRSIPTTAEGMERGLKPVTSNPVDMAILKMHEMNRYVMAHELLQDLKAAKSAQFVSFAEKAPEGWKQLDDKVFTVFGDPNIPIKEYYDEAVWGKLATLAKNLDINHERKINIGGTRLGYAQKGGRIVTRFATPEAVIAHEIGHQMDWKYGLKGKLVKKSPYREELRKLADLKWEGKRKEDVAQSFRTYVRKGEEKMATMIEALVHAPEKFQEAAPETFKFLKDFIADKPELAPLLDIKPSLKFGLRSSTVDAGGLVIRGRYYAPEQVATPINRYVSTGLKGLPLYDIVRAFGNSLNQVQLGLSGFHLGTTSLNAVISQFALATRQIARGQVFKATANLFGAPLAPIRNLIEGGRVARSYLRSDQASKYTASAKAIEEAGGRIGIGEEYIDNRIEKMLHAFANRRYMLGILRSIPAAVEAQAIPVLKWIVPRMKIGAFHDLAADIFDQGTKKGWSQDKIRSEIQKAWDSIDNRFGQVVYDNLSWNKIAKDLAFIGIRSVGWNYGTWRELGGGAKDAAAQLGSALNGRGFNVTDRMAYTFMLPIVIAALGALYMYTHTKEWPETAKDYFYPKNGKKEEDGTDARVSLPSYMKDVFSFYQHPVDTALHKVNPGISTMFEMMQNKDYYGNEIRNEDDPAVKQLFQVGKHIGGSFLPFTLRNVQRQKELGEKGILPKVETFAGIAPAPRAVERSDAEALAHDMLQRRAPSGAHTEAEQKKRQRLQALEQEAREGKLTGENLKARLASGEITKQDLETVKNRVTTPGLLRQFKQLTVPEALKVWQAATPTERDLVKGDILIKMAQGLPKMTRDEQLEYAPAMRQVLLDVKELGRSRNNLRVPFSRKTEAAAP